MNRSSRSAWWRVIPRNRIKAMRLECTILPPFCRGAEGHPKARGPAPKARGGFYGGTSEGAVNPEGGEAEAEAP